VTILTRGAFLLGGEAIVLPDIVQRALRCAPAAALLALVVKRVLVTPSGIELGLSNPAPYAALAAAAWFLWRRSMLEAIVIGMLVDGLLQFAR
jgi:branched-subunit amino acid transport protein